MEWWPSKPRIEPQLPENACKSDGYLPVSGDQLALVMAKVTTTNHCGQNTTEWSDPQISIYSPLKYYGSG